MAQEMENKSNKPGILKRIHNSGIGYLIVLILAAVIGAYIANCCIKNKESEPVVVNSKPPKEIISFNDALQLYGGYTDNRACVIERFERGKDSMLLSNCNPKRKINPNFIAARSFFLPSDFLKHYMAYVKKISSENGVKDITGYRLYLGNYPQEGSFEDGKPIPDPSRTTFFIAPTTITQGSKLNKGFTFTDDNNDGKPELILLEDFLEKKQNNKQGVLNNKTPQGIKTASFFSFSTTSQNFEISTLANDLGSYP